MRIFATTAMALLLAQPLAAQDGGTSGGQAQALEQQDVQFAQQAAESGLLEVRLGELALERAGQADVQDFGRSMVEDHEQANQNLVAIAQEKGIELPETPSEEGQQHVEELQQASGGAFDVRYMELMVQEHQKDVEAFQQQTQAGQDPDLVAFAEQTLPVLQQHLARAEEVQGGLSAPAAAQQETAPAAGQQQSEGQAAAEPGRAIRPQQVVGSAVLNSVGEKIGEIEDVVMDENGEVFAVISIGGFLGIGAKEVGLPLERLEPGPESEGLVTDFTGEELEAMPSYEEGGYISLSNPQQ